MQDLQRIRSSGEHLLALINDILRSLKDRGRQDGNAFGNFRCIPSDRRDSQHGSAGGGKNTNKLQVNIANNVGEMHADLTKVRQILLNLLSNSCKFTTAGTISLNVARIIINDCDWLQFEVVDTGIGIAPEQKEKLFREFSQADTSIARKYGGTGLGLAITHRFIQVMQGTITVDSQLGRGSRFTIQLPHEIRPQSGGPAPLQLPVANPAPSQSVHQDRALDYQPYRLPPTTAPNI